MIATIQAANGVKDYLIEIFTKAINKKQQVNCVSPCDNFSILNYFNKNNINAGE